MLLEPEFRDEVVERLRGTDLRYIGQTGLTLEKILADEDKIDRLWAIYQKSILEYGIEPARAYKDAFKEIFCVALEDKLSPEQALELSKTAYAVSRMAIDVMNAAMDVQSMAMARVADPDELRAKLQDIKSKAWHAIRMVESNAAGENNAQEGADAK